ncbi:hypothetical protein CPB83DRAFT_758032 [Crepidotus variabilis]|uniref:Galectin n=1 Tax=Crepidotus variabilis TaxID=179855 RepID=A0A9P6JUX9_9AGAR|nr:hypothetical protein CPB83DRAFT_758032 [Crepidotus variabilis]
MATPSRYFHKVPLNQITTLPEPVKVDGILIFRSFDLNMYASLSGKGDYTLLDLLNAGGDVMLHISVRCCQNAIVFNTSTKNTGWGPEEIVELKGHFEGFNTTVAIYNHPDMFQIITNGRTAHYFKKRIQGDVAKLSYFTAEGLPSFFSDPIAVETFKDWGALVPGSRSGN